MGLLLWVPFESDYRIDKAELPVLKAIDLYKMTGPTQNARTRNPRCFVRSLVIPDKV